MSVEGAGRPPNRIRRESFIEDDAKDMEAGMAAGDLEGQRIGRVEAEIGDRRVRDLEIDRFESQHTH